MRLPLFLGFVGLLCSAGSVQAKNHAPSRGARLLFTAFNRSLPQVRRSVALSIGNRGVEVTAEFADNGRILLAGKGALGSVTRNYRGETRLPLIFEVATDPHTVGGKLELHLELGGGIGARYALLSFRPLRTRPEVELRYSLFQSGNDFTANQGAARLEFYDPADDPKGVAELLQTWDWNVGIDAQHFAL